MQSNPSTHHRSLLKGLSWETISTTVTFGLAWLIFGRAVECILFAVICFIVKFVMFYLHERAWHQISYGKKCIDGKEEERTKWPSAYP